MGTIRVVAIYFDPEHLILLKLSIRLGFGAKFYRRPCHHIDGANGIDENSNADINTATPSTIYREIETSIGGVYWWRICVAGETASSVNWQTTINSISILESANWPIKIFTIRRVRRMENRNFIFGSGTKREWRQPVDGRWHLTRLHAAPHVFFFLSFSLLESRLRPQSGYCFRFDKKNTEETSRIPLFQVGGGGGGDGASSDISLFASPVNKFHRRSSQHTERNY